MRKGGTSATLNKFIIYMGSRAWCWTLNNYSEEEETTLLRLLEELSQGIKYMCFGQEEGAEGTPHLQGFTRFTRPHRLGAVKRILGRRLHLEKAHGTDSQNRAYCSKTRDEDEHPNDVFHENGTMSNPGARTDLDAARARITEGATDLQIAEEFFPLWARYRQSFSAFRALLNPTISRAVYQINSFPMDWQTLNDFNFNKCMILWGLPGIGKTHLALSILGDSLVVSHIDELSKFDPTIHKGIIFDDMDFNHIPVSAQIHITDIEFDRAIHIRYGLANIPKNTKKIFTTNIDQGAIFNLDPTLGVKRRVSIHHLMKQ